jgi:hypothetical protein
MKAEAARQCGALVKPSVIMSVDVEIRDSQPEFLIRNVSVAGD